MRSVIVVLGIGCVVLSACGSPRGGTGGGIDPGDGGAEGGADPDAAATGDGGGGASCAAFCARSAAAGCPAFNASACMNSCAQLLASASCRAQGEAAVRCGSAATITCDADGDTTSSDCDAEIMAVVACLGGSP